MDRWSINRLLLLAPVIMMLLRSVMTDAGSSLPSNLTDDWTMLSSSQLAPFIMLSSDPVAPLIMLSTDSVALLIILGTTLVHVAQLIIQSKWKAVLITEINSD